MASKWSRRDFLKASALFSTGVLLAACAPTAQLQHPAAAGATETPKTAAPSGGVQKVVFSTYVSPNFETTMTAILNGWKEKTPNVDYKAQFIPQSTDYWARIQSQVASGTPPDCGKADYGRLVSYSKNGSLLDITDYMAASKFPIDKSFPGASAQYRWATGDFDSGAAGGNYYGIPSDAQAQIFAYNKKMFDDAGVPYPTDDWTWNDMLAAAQKMTQPDQNKWGMAPIPTYILFKGNFVWAAGGAIHSPDFTKSMLADPRTIEAYKWNWDLIFTHKVAPPPGGGSAQPQNPFMSGQVGMCVEDVGRLTDFATIKDFGWDVAMLPKHPVTGKRTVTIESDGWWIYKGAQNPGTAWQLLSYMGSPEGQKLFISTNDFIPSTYQDIATDWYARKPPDNKGKILQNINEDSAKVDFTYFEFGTISSAVWPVIDRAFSDGTDITKAMQDADKVMNEELTKAWELLKA